MKRPAKQRINKYEAKIDGSVIGKRYDDTKKLSVRTQKDYFARAEILENKVKAIIDGQPSILHHFYIAFAEEFAKKQLTNERKIIYDKWERRGLNTGKLDEIAKNLFGWSYPVTPPTLKKYEYCYSEWVDAWNIYGSEWGTQTFTVGTVGANEKFNITSVKIYGCKQGNPGTLTVSIKHVDIDGNPTGEDLSIGTIDGNEICECWDKCWIEVPMSSYELQPSTKYAIVCRCSDGSEENYVAWFISCEVEDCLGGEAGVSDDAGVGWWMFVECDFLFEVWGTGPQP